MKPAITGFMDLMAKDIQGLDTTVGVVYSDTRVLIKDVYYVKATYIGEETSFGQAMQALRDTAGTVVSAITADGLIEEFHHGVNIHVCGEWLGQDIKWFVRQDKVGDK